MEIKLISFEKDGKEAIYVQLYNALVKQIMEGYICQGDRLPSVRKLAKQLHLSKTTIENAYDRLVSEGYLISKEKSGYYCDMPPLKKEHASLNEKTQLPIVSRPIRFDLSSRSLEAQPFDRKVWRRYTNIVLGQEQIIGAYGKKQGEDQLRQELASFLYTERGVVTKMEQLVIGAGIQPLLYLFCSMFRQQKLRVGFLKPGFRQAMAVFLDCQHEVVLLDDLQMIENTPLDVLYLSPASLDLKMNHRVALVNLLKEKHIYLIEDDHNGEMHYLSANVACMQGLLASEQVFYLSSFSKLLLPSIRLACMSVPQTLLPHLMSCLENYNQTASVIEQQVLALYIQDGHMERRIKYLKKSHLKKSKAMKEALLKYFSITDFELLETSGCFYLKGNFDEHFYQRLEEKGILVGSHEENHLLLYFGGIKLDDITLIIDEIFSDK